jgi:hypothetical protein
MVIQSKIGWKTKILVFFSCFQVNFFRFFFEHFKSHKKGGGKNSKNWVCSFCTISSRTSILKNKDDWLMWGNVMSDLIWVESSTIKQIFLVLYEKVAEFD